MISRVEQLKNQPVFTTREAIACGISRRMLSYYTQQGILERIKKGVYISPYYEPDTSELEWLDLATAASNIEGGVICLMSALVYYELTDEIMDRFWVAIENANAHTHYPMCNIVRMRNIELGVKTVTMANMKVKIFDKERTIIDAFRLLDEETAIKALKKYMDQNPNLDKLSTYSKALRVSKVKNYIKAFLV